MCFLELFAITERLFREALACLVSEFVQICGYSRKNRADGTNLSGPRVSFIALNARARGTCSGISGSSFIIFLYKFRRVWWYFYPIPKLEWAFIPDWSTCIINLTTILMNRSPRWLLWSTYVRLGRTVLIAAQHSMIARQIPVVRTLGRKRAEVNLVAPSTMSSSGQTSM